MSEGPSNRIAWVATALAVSALAALGYSHFQGREAEQRIELDAARRLADLSAQVTRAERELADTTARLKQSEARLTDFDAKLAEREGDRAAIAEMYRELSRSVDDRLLAEVEQILVLSQQQLQLSGNINGALVALEAADQRLQRAEKLNTSRLRRAIAQDVDRLRALPAVDVAGLAIKLDTLAASIDTLPLALGGPLPSQDVKDAKPIAKPNAKSAVVSTKTQPEASAQTAAPVSAGPTPAPAPAPTPWGARVWRDFWGELSQLVRVREALPNESALIAPREAYFARQNLKLRLLSARLSLLARDEANYKADLSAAAEIIHRYFDARQKVTQGVRDSVKQLAASPIAISLPDINASLAEMRAARLPRERIGR